MSQNPIQPVDQFADKLAQLRLLEPSDDYKNFKWPIRTTFWWPRLRWALPVVAVFALLVSATTINRLFFSATVDEPIPLTSTSANANNDLPYQLGKHYFEIADTANIGTIAPEVIQFFWYPCRPCYTFETAFSDWSKTLGGDVSVKRVPAIWSQPMQEQARAYYAAEILGVLDKVHLKLYQVSQDRGHNFNDLDSFADVFAEAGVERFLFEKTFYSDAVSEQISMAKSDLKKYMVASTPTLIVSGRYLVEPGSAGGLDNTLNIANYLLNKK